MLGIDDCCALVYTPDVSDQISLYLSPILRPSSNHFTLPASVQGLILKMLPAAFAACMWELSATSSLALLGADSMVEGYL